MSSFDSLTIIRRFGAAALLGACLLIATGEQVRADTTPPHLSKFFAAASVPVDSPTELTFLILNVNGTALTGIGFTDTLPTDMVVSTPNGLSGSCGGGTITATAGSDSISLAGASLPLLDDCVFSVDVTLLDVGSYTNTTSEVTSNQGDGSPASASIKAVPAVVPEPETIFLLASGLVGLGLCAHRKLIAGTHHARNS
jgi:hypothetical protein